MKQGLTAKPWCATEYTLGIFVFLGGAGGDHLGARRCRINIDVEPARAIFPIRPLLEHLINNILLWAAFSLAVASTFGRQVRR